MAAIPPLVIGILLLVLLVFLGGAQRRLTRVLTYLSPMLLVAVLGLLSYAFPGRFTRVWLAATVFSTYTLPIVFAVTSWRPKIWTACVAGAVSALLTIVLIGQQLIEGTAPMHLMNTPDEVAYQFNLSPGLLLSLLIIQLGGAVICVQVGEFIDEYRTLRADSDDAVDHRE